MKFFHKHKIISFLLGLLIVISWAVLFYWPTYFSHFFTKDEQNGPILILDEIPSAAKMEDEDSGETEKSVEKQKQEYDSEITTNPIIFGYSVDKKPIEGYIFGDGEDCLFMFGSIHGNEMGSGKLMNALVDEIKKDPNLVGDDMKVIILPISNPDGYYDRIDKANANNVNINLNFPTKGWSKYSDSSVDNYAGEEPFSEPESRVIRDIVNKYKPRRMISFHAKGALVNPEYHTASYNLATWYSNKTGYQLYNDPSWDFYGTATKWFVEEAGGDAAITVELTNYSYADWNINKKALLELIS